MAFGSNNSSVISRRYVLALLLVFALVLVFHSSSGVKLQQPSNSNNNNIDNHNEKSDNNVDAAQPIPESNEPKSPVPSQEEVPVQAQKSNKVATIIENRPLDNLVPLILHFSTVLGPEWAVVLFTDAAMVDLPMFKSAAFQRLLQAGQVSIIPLGADVKFEDSTAVSRFLTTPWIWEQLAPADHVLLFQSDSVICSKSERKMEDFLVYDFVGAPLFGFWGDGYNGGLSLRNRNMMLEVLQNWNFTTERLELPEPIVVEDQWYYKKMLELPPKPDGSPAANFPSIEVAATFAVQSVWNDQPLGYHQVTTWQSENLTAITNWCPEWRLLKEGFYI